MAVLTACPEIFVRTICIEGMLERFSELPVGKRRHDIDFRKEVSFAVSTLQTVVDGSLFYSQGSGVDNLVSEIDVGRKTEITQVNIGIEVAGQISVAETTHGMNRRIIVSYIARQAEHPVERVRSRQYGSIVMNVSTVNERPDEVSVLNIIIVNHRIMLQLVLENGRKSGFLYLTGIIQERIE